MMEMKSVAPHDRPREKLERVGAGGLGDNELLAIVLGHGAPRAGALDLANAVLAAVGGLHGLARAPLDHLQHVPGIGGARAAQLIAAVEAGRRTLLRGPPDRVQIMSPRDSAELLLPQYGSREVEHFGVVLLDTKHFVLRSKVLSIGTLDASIVHPRDVFREAARAGAAALVLFHNHPSGDPRPSPDDVALTRRLVVVGELMGISVLDHIVLADRQFYTMQGAGELDAHKLPRGDWRMLLP
jgi:DNA repair protein RadC